MIVDGEPYGSVSFTSQGFFKAMSYNMSYGGDYEKGSATYSYDADGHLTKFDDNWQYKEDGEYSSGTVGIIYEWTNGNLNKCSYYEKSTNNGETRDEEWSTTIQYSNVENKFRQLTPGFLSRFELWDYTAIAGLYGIGPKKLPKMIVDEYATTTFEYELYSDGSIRQEKIVTNYGSTMIYTFFYTPAN